jgi:hypothetical protein
MEHKYQDLLDTLNMIDLISIKDENGYFECTNNELLQYTGTQNTVFLLHRLNKLQDDGYIIRISGYLTKGKSKYKILKRKD